MFNDCLKDRNENEKMSWIKLNIGVSLSGPTIGISPDFKELISIIHSKRYIKKCQINNIHFPIPRVGLTSMTVEVNGGYKHGFYAFSSIAFEGHFGENPEVFMIYSVDNNPIEFDSSEHALNSDNLSVIKLDKRFFESDRYEYGIVKELNYYSNNDSQYDIRPFIIVVFGDESLGFATITVINKSTSTCLSSGTIRSIMPGSGNDPFQPQARILVWPTGKDLLRSLKEPQTGRAFRLDKNQINNILSLEKYFINLMKPEVSDVLSKKYISEQPL